MPFDEMISSSAPAIPDRYRYTNLTSNEYQGIHSARGPIAAGAPTEPSSPARCGRDPTWQRQA
jgi:hypothetical protein